MEILRKIMVTGSWEPEDFQGTCNEPGHVRQNEDQVSSAVLEDLTVLEEFLKSNPGLVSLQLASSHKFTFEYHGNLLKLIGENCPHLECLSIRLLMEEAECKKQKKLNLDSATEPHPHAEIWDAFVTSVSTTFQHISFPGDYGIPLCAMKLLLERCPQLDSIDGRFSKECTICSVQEVQELTKEKAESVVYVNLYYDKVDLQTIVSQCSQVRTFLFNWTDGEDLMLLGNENMKKLVELDIADRRFLKEEEGDNSDDENPEGSKPSDSVTGDLLLPYDCRLRHLSVHGVLSLETWNLLSKRAPRLQFISYTNPDLLCPSLLDEFLTIPTLRSLVLNMPNTLSSEDLVPFLEKFIENSRYHLTHVGTSLTIGHIGGDDKEIVQETVEDVLKTLNSTVVHNECTGDFCPAGRQEEEDVSVTLHFEEYEGTFGFRFSVEMNGIDVEGKGQVEGDYEYVITASKYFDAKKYTRKLRLIGRREKN